MSKIKAAIIEDEYPTARLLRAMIASLRPEWETAVLPGSIAGAAAWLAEHDEPDILFLDIHLQDGDAFELLKRTMTSGLVVFTTAYDEYALRAFSVNSIDYLLKPITQERLAEAITKFERLSSQQVDLQNRMMREILQGLAVSPPLHRDPVYRSRFLIAKGGEMHIVHANDIAFFYTHNRTTHAVTIANRTYMLNMRLDALTEELDPRTFFRTNRQTIVNINAIRKIEPYFHNSVVVQTEPESPEKITVSKERLGAFKSWLNS